MEVFPLPSEAEGGGTDLGLAGLCRVGGIEGVAAFDHQRGAYQARKTGFRLASREAGPLNHRGDKVDADQKVVDKQLYLAAQTWAV